MRYSNLHTHTTFSDGLSTVEENILSAISKNMLSIGFSDHSCTDFDLRYCIQPDKVAEYISQVRYMQKKYQNQIEIYLGVECDGYTQLKNRNLYDYVLGDCHYIKMGGEYLPVDDAKEDQLEFINEYFNGSKMAYAKAYYETYTERTAVNKPDILGHFDLLTKFSLFDENCEDYRKMATEALVAALEITPIIELNTGAICRKLRTTPYPADFLLKEVLAHNGKITLCSDSHHKDNLDFYFDQSVQLLKSLGFKSVVHLCKNKFEEVEI
ncbi:MAG: histidinol-phosphatase HisJ family protein [Oscillospiraceae bacterium]|nr:histidinol-phosphatase HisJ family protein [Oscillospiraceae bacterium]